MYNFEEQLANMSIGDTLFHAATNYDIVKVPGGWIFTMWDSANGCAVDSGTFVPEP